MTPAQQKAFLYSLARWRENPADMVRELFGVEPDPWQEKVLRAFPHQPRIAMQAPIDVEAIVPTPTGPRRWGDIQKGDKVFAQDGSITEVKHRFNTNKVRLYRVTFCDGTSLRVSPDHEWRICTSYDRLTHRSRTVSTAELATMILKRGRQRLVSLPAHGAAQYRERRLPADPYIFGLWLGDGIANEPRLIAPDSAIRQAIRARGQEITESEAVKKRIGLVGWLPRLRSTGVSRCRSYEKFIPWDYKTSSPAQRLDLLRGLMDSDGTVAKNGQTYLATCSPRLAEDFLWLARSLGFYAKSSGPYKINDGENRDSYRVTISGNVHPFLADTTKSRRWYIPPLYKSTRFIESVEWDGEGDAMCIEVKHHTHCFLATDFILTHNCKGPGKTCLLAWITWNYLITRHNPQCAATSISGDNLSNTFWREMAKWRQKSAMLVELYEWTKTKIFLKERPDTHYIVARAWPKSGNSQEQADTLAGIHDDYVLFIIDEAGGIPESVLVTAEAALSSCVEGHIVMAGNPTDLNGALALGARKQRADWHVIEITGDPDDPNRSPRMDLAWCRKMIRDFGRDHPYVLVNVLGKFPPSSLNALIGDDEVDASMARFYREHEIKAWPKIIGVDVARFGDDSSAICRRQGFQMFPIDKRRNLDSLQGASWVNRTWIDFDASACFIDGTGGFGSGWIDQLTNLGRAGVSVHFNSKPAKEHLYSNKRTEMALELVAWIRKGGALPPNNIELKAALTRSTYTFTGDKMVLAPKEIIKEELGYSPDDMDAAMLTFAEPVVLAAQSQYSRPRGLKHEYDPFAELNKPQSRYSEGY